jgi:anti-anti-sigma factor
MPPRLVADRLTHAPAVRDVHLDCAEIDFCDSSGLSALILVHHRVTAAGARPHLDNRRPPLNRLLELTGTMAHLTGRTRDSRARIDSWCRASELR